MDTKFCEKCGAKIPSEAAFCPGCGQRVQTEADEINIAEVADCHGTDKHIAVGSGTKGIWGWNTIPILFLLLVIAVATTFVPTFFNGSKEDDESEAIKESKDEDESEEYKELMRIVDSLPTTPEPPVGIELRKDDDDIYMKVTNKDPSQGLDVCLAIGSHNNYHRTIQPGGQADFKQGYWGEGSFGIVRVDGYDYIIAVHIKGNKYTTRCVSKIPIPVDVNEQAPISATLDKSNNLTVVNKDPNKGYDACLEVGEKRVRQTLTPGGKVVFSDFEWHDGTVGVLTVPGFDSVLVVYDRGDTFDTNFEMKGYWE